MWQIAFFATVLALIVLGLLYAFESEMDLNQGEDFTEEERDDDARRTSKPKRDDPTRSEPRKD